VPAPIRRFAPDTRVLLGAYALLLLIAVLLIPLRIEELLNLLASQQHSLGGFLSWIPKAPGSSPLYYLVQFPIVLALGVSRLGARLPSLLLALASCYLFLRLVKTIPLRRPYLALAVFSLLPTEYRAGTEGLPLELALCLLLVATLLFLQLIRTPTLRLSAWYAGALALCLYSDRFSFLPAIGYVLFLFAFVNRAHERRVIWFLLPATAAPVLVFLPYYFWTHPLTDPNWLSPPLPPGTPSSIYLQALRNFAGGGVTGYVLSCLLIAGLFAGAWSLFRAAPGAPPRAPVPSRTISIFCLFGGAAATIALVLVLDIWNRYPFLAAQVLWAIPAAVVCTFTALERFASLRTRARWTTGAAAALIALSLVTDAQYATTSTENLREVARLIPSQLRGDSCVVFVSERLSRNLFLLVDPDLRGRECGNFFHGRVVLASHAYVTPFQQEDAESFFRGLNFVEVKRVRAGGGQIIVMDTAGEGAPATPR
jgi:hypothetical protein